MTPFRVEHALGVVVFVTHVCFWRRAAGGVGEEAEGSPCPPHLGKNRLAVIHERSQWRRK